MSPDMAVGLLCGALVASVAWALIARMMVAKVVDAAMSARKSMDVTRRSCHHVTSNDRRLN